MLARIRLAAITAAMVIGLGAALAGAAHVSNGNFERGTLRGWERDYLPNAATGRWHVYDGPFLGPPISKPRGDTPLLPEPPQGTFAAATHQGDPSAQLLSQVVKLRANRRHRLRFQLAYRNHNTKTKMRGGGPGFITPRTFSRAVPNQQFRMDVMKPNAPITSLKRKHVLKRVYRTDVGDPDFRPYRRVTANLTELAGRRVRLRFAVVVTQEVLNVGIDAVKVKSKRIG